MIYAESVAVGMQLAFEECQRQFKWDRWNCPQRVFGSIFKDRDAQANREVAFIQSIINAGIVHTLARNCSLGHFEHCTCRRRPRLKTLTRPTDEDDNGVDERDVRQEFMWRGCSDAVHFATGIAKNFLETVYKHRSSQDLKTRITLHNSHVGRLVSFIFINEFAIDGKQLLFERRSTRP